MAYIVVQHLDPEHVSTLAELLQWVTPLTVAEASDGVAVEPDHVYVIPPNRDITLSDGLLHLMPPTEPRGLRLSVDFFLRSLALEQRETAVGVILSGMGSDGLLGLRAIREKGGLTLAQDPKTAGAASMPQSVIDAGLADVVAPPEEMPERIANQLGRLLLQPIAGSAEDRATTESFLAKIVLLLRDRCGADFSLYKSNTLFRRIERRIALHQLTGIAQYLAFLQTTPQEQTLLFRELLIGVTSFFRDPAVWEVLRDDIIPALLEKSPGGKTLRAWVPACSSGEEAYSLAIVFKEALERIKPAERFTLQIYATDLDPDAIDKARKGVYPQGISADLTPERLARYFAADDSGYRVVKEIRDMVVFAPQNIVSDPPFTKLDILCCRNLLIYFRSELQKKLLPLFHYALNEDGVLILGSAETISSAGHLFKPIDAKSRIFGRIEKSWALRDLSFPTHIPAANALAMDLGQGDPGESLGQLTDQFIQQRYAPAAVLVNGDGDILYISGRTGKYLEPAAGKVNINLHAMAREGLREALVGVIRKAQSQSQPIKIKGLHVKTGGNDQMVDLTVQGIEHPEGLRGRVLVVFHDVATPTKPGKAGKTVTAAAHEAIMQELLQTRETLRNTHEEMQTALEELKSANEEHQSTNEELQSTNEELTTSKEEMQSLNEELQTVNAELQSKLDALTWEHNDMANLLNSTEIATVFLDSGMRVRRFTPHAANIFKLIPSDIGRPLSDVKNVLDYPRLIDDAENVLRTLVFSETQVSAGAAGWFRIRIMPYRTQDNVIDGVVITFTDISAVKKMETELRLQQAAISPSGTVPDVG